MEINELVEQQIREVGISLGVEESRQVGGGRWLLKIIQDLEIEVVHEQAAGKVVLSAVIGQPASAAETPVYLLLLQYNYSWEETGGLHAVLDREEGGLRLRQEIIASAMISAALQEQLGHFCNMVLLWRHLVENFSVEAPGRDLEDLDMIEMGIRI